MMDDQEKREKIQAFFRNPFVIIGIIIQIVFIILIIILIQNITKKEDIKPEVKIENTSSIFDDLNEKLPDQAKSYFETELYNIISINKQNITNIADSGATVRQNSTIHQYFEKFNLHYLYFIIDIPSIQQSYQFRYEWSNDKNNKYIPVNESLMSMCLPKDKMIYPDFNCQDKYNKKGPSSAIYSLIKNITLKVGDQSFSAVPKGKTSDENFYYQVAINTCGNDNLKNQANQIFENQIKELGFEISEIPHQTIGYCDR